MPTTYLSLPFDLSCEISNLVLKNTVVTITLDIIQKTRLVNHYPFIDQACEVDNKWLTPYAFVAVPTDSGLRGQLKTQKHAISLLKVSRQVHADLRNSIYSHVRLHIKLPVDLDFIWSHEPDLHYSSCLTEMVNTPVLRTLFQKIGRLSWPWISKEPWDGFFSDQATSALGGLHTIVLYDGSIAGHYGVAGSYPIEKQEHLWERVVSWAKRNVKKLRQIPRLHDLRLTISVNLRDEVGLPKTKFPTKGSPDFSFLKAHWSVQTSIIWSTPSARL